MSGETVQEVFEAVCRVAPHISSGLLKRREYVGEENPSDEKQLEGTVKGINCDRDTITTFCHMFLFL